MDLVAQRLSAQQIGRHDFAAPRELVAWLGAVQAQDYYGALWALGLRLKAATDASIERALDEGDILRTHAMRGTWQFVAREDARWLVGLVGPGVIARAARRHRELGLDGRALRRSQTALERALRGGNQLTRGEVADVLDRAGISPAGQRLSHILMCAELESAITSGRRRGKQGTYALLDDRVPASKPLARQDALHVLARRYLQSRGPATPDDFQWWSGLTMSEARAALSSVRVANRHARPAAETHLLPAFDEWLIGYRDRSAVATPAVEKRLPERGGMLSPVVIVDGRIVGTWSRTLGRRVAVRHDLYVPVDARAVERATERYLDFLGGKR